MEFVLDPTVIKNLDKNSFKDGFTVEELDEKTVRKIRKCKACKRPVLGHQGKFGIGKCKFSEAKSDEVNEIVKAIMINIPSSNQLMKKMRSYMKT